MLNHHFKSSSLNSNLQATWILPLSLLLLVLMLFSSTVKLVKSATGFPLGPPPTEQPLDQRPLEDSQYEQMLAGSSYFIYLPQITVPSGCNLNSEEQAVADMAMAHANQGRALMGCDPILAQVARARAQDMAQRDYFNHTNPDGHGPNYLVEVAGYDLPNWYNNASNGNNIESIAAGYTTAESAWTAWLNSSGHRVHVLAESSFWQEQTNYGIGYYYDPTSTYHHYWVFISAPPE